MVGVEAAELEGLGTKINFRKLVRRAQQCSDYVCDTCDCLTHTVVSFQRSCGFKRACVPKNIKNVLPFFPRPFPKLRSFCNSNPTPTDNDTNLTADSGTTIGSLDPGRKMGIVFTCSVCQHRVAKTFSYLAYTKGVVIIECPGCQNRHLIADNKGWFQDKPINIEGLVTQQGGKVRRITDIKQLDEVDADGIEAFKQKFGAQTSSEPTPTKQE